MKIEKISEEQKEKLLMEYKYNFGISLTAKGEIKSYYRGICAGIEIALRKLGLVTDEEIARIQEEEKEEQEDERAEPGEYSEVWIQRCGDC